jgi:hypothetical protein
MSTTSMPGFTGGASFYKTTHTYCGSRRPTSGDAGSTVVVPQLSCENNCYAAAALCTAGCGFLDVFCDAGCAAALVLCLNACPSSGGGAGRPPCCPRGKKCCGGCIKKPGGVVFCDGECIGLHEKCVTDGNGGVN